MTAPPFLTYHVRNKKDIVRARQGARQVASLLHYPVTEQACIAAGAFAICCQARAAYGKFVLCFQIAEGRLHIHARRPETASGPRNRVAAALAGPEALLRLVKPLPAERTLSEVDVAWLVQQAEEDPAGVFEEIAKQNQEVLALLHELHVLKKQLEPGPAVHPHAA